MRYDIHQPILGLDGKELKGLFGKGDDKVITYASLFTLVSANGLPDDSAEDKYISFKMGMTYAHSEPGSLVDIDDKGSVRLKKVIGTNYSPTVYGRVVDFLAEPWVAPPTPAPAPTVAPATPSPEQAAAALRHPHP